MAADTSNGVAVASAEHVAIGLAQGFVQVGHGKGSPLERLHTGDRIACYSPVRTMGARDACQAFTAIGSVPDERVYQGTHAAPGRAGTRVPPSAGCGPASDGPALGASVANGFEPFRKDVDWLAATEAPIRPLLEALSFTQGESNWGCALRFGLLKVTAADLALIAQAMPAMPRAFER